MFCGNTLQNAFDQTCGANSLLVGFKESWRVRDSGSELGGRCLVLELWFRTMCLGLSVVVVGSGFAQAVILWYVFRRYLLGRAGLSS